MNIGAAIFSILSNDSTLTTDLGGAKIYPLKAPQKSTVPYVIYRQISGDPSDTKDGVSTLDTIRTQIDIYHNDFNDMHTIEERVRSLLDKYRGTIAGVNIDSIQYLTPNETWEDDDDDFRLSVDYNIRAHRVATVPGGGFLETSFQFFQRFTNHTGTTLTVTSGTLPSSEFDTNLAVFRDGRLLLEGVDFTVSGNVITLTLEAMTENIIVLYRFDTAFVNSERFNDHTGATITVTGATLPTANYDINLMVYRDGRLLLEGVDFTASGNVITLTMEAINEDFLIRFKNN